MKRVIPENVLRAWGLEDAELLEMPVHEGSPERVRFRQALKASNGEIYVLECLSAEKAASRQEQARVLLTLQVRQFKEVPAWLATLDGSLGVMGGDAFWQLRRWIPGDPLPREEYAVEDWRGRACASLLVDLKSKSEGFSASQVFRIGHYISHLMRHIRSHNSALFQDLQLILEPCPVFGGGARASSSLLPRGFSSAEHHLGESVHQRPDRLGVLRAEGGGLRCGEYAGMHWDGCARVSDEGHGACHGEIPARTAFSLGCLLAMASRNHCRAAFCMDA